MGALLGLADSASAVENVAAEGVGFGEGGVVEVLGGVVGHAELLHDAAARRQAISTQGENGSFALGIWRPT